VTPPPSQRLGSSWRNLWAAGGISALGDGAYFAAVPLLAVSFTTNPRLIAGVATAAFLPWLLLSLHAGALADRYDRRRLMWTAQIVQATAVGMVAVVAALHVHQIWLLYISSFALGAAETVFSNAAQSVLPSVVPPALLEAANGRQYATETVTDLFVGPPLGSMLFAIAPALPFWLDALSFLVSILLLTRVRYRPDFEPPAIRERRPMRVEIAEGLRWLLRHRLLRTLAVLLAITNMAAQIGNSTFVLFAKSELHVSTRLYGVLLATSAIGGVLGGITAQRTVRSLGTRRAIIAASGLGAVAATIVALQAHNLYVMGICLALGAFSSTNWNVATVSMRQRMIPDYIRGRVNSTYRLAGWGSIPIGALIGGFIAADFGLRAPWFVSAAMRLAVFAAALFVLRAGDFPEASAPVSAQPDLTPATAATTA
jgi:MFS family permease